MITFGEKKTKIFNLLIQRAQTERAKHGISVADAVSLKSIPDVSKDNKIE